MKRDPGFIATIGSLLKNREYRRNLEDVLISTKKLKTVDSLFNYLIYLNGPKEKPRPPD
ncbi:hypothetical protein [Legionella busanensis]|uniref:hypothetical protein n=1 Tax=Legionella busanensis TaxID=190655 RepID=UPI0013592495|nr:hypothetical protein [Legionella busanensis]